MTPGAEAARRRRLATRVWLALCALSVSTSAPVSGAEPRFDPKTHQIVSGVSPAQLRARARLLTASCAACHGTDGRSVGITPALAGVGREYFIAQMQDFKSGARPGTVMNHNSQGYSYEEIELMAEYFSRLPRGDCGP